MLVMQVGTDGRTTCVVITTGLVWVGLVDRYISHNFESWSHPHMFEKS